MKKSEFNSAQGLAIDRAAGFTIIELMVLMAVLAIVISVGLPQLNTFFKGNRMVTNTNDLVAGLHVARSEAIKRGSRVSICKSSNADAATPACDTGAGWEDGWFVFVEGTNVGNTVGTYNSNDGAVLKISAGVEGNATITPDSTSIQNFVSFTSRGTPKQSNGATQSGVFRVCDDRGLKNAAGNVIARGVVLSATGRARVTNNETKIGSCP